MLRIEGQDTYAGHILESRVARTRAMYEGRVTRLQDRLTSLEVDIALTRVRLASEQKQVAKVEARLKAIVAAVSRKRDQEPRHCSEVEATELTLV